jgi:tetratricopeptide (TPR) repeat protein
MGRGMSRTPALLSVVLLLGVASVRAPLAAAPSDPAKARTFVDRGNEWYRKGELDKALKHYDEAVRLDPAFPEPLSGRALIRAVCPDETFRNGPQAVRDAKRACELSKWKDPIYLEVLAVAHAGVGEFGEAIRWLSKALEDPAYAKKSGVRARALLKIYERQGATQAPPPRVKMGK